MAPVRSRGAAVLVVLGLAAAVATTGCRAKAGTVLLVTVTLSGSAPDVASLDVTLTSPAGVSENQYPQGAGSISFPTTLTAQLPPTITGDLTIDVKATDAGGEPVAHGHYGPFTLRPGARQEIVVSLDCGGAPCALDGGAAAASDAAADAVDPSCGNGRIDVGETCDTAIAAGAPGACPSADCDDGIACTLDARVGADCTATCTHTEVLTPTAGDKCCPAGATSTTDPDCSPTCGNGTVDVGELCDTGVAAGAPGACPAADACDDADPCTTDALISAGTCSAVCTHVLVTAQSGGVRDGCCPAGAWHAVDDDCPVTCGDGRLDPGELCDPGLPATASGGCPVTCDDGDPCTLDARAGADCQSTCTHAPITSAVSGDGCCPTGATHRTDADCPEVCGNGVVEPGEACDTAIAAPAPGACPKSCPPSPSACLVSALAGAVSDCTARCVLTRVTACSATRDGCCPDGCTAATDPDCSPTCGDGVVQAAAGETCDTAIRAGAPGACPQACSDGVSCTSDVLLGAGTCQAVCLFLPITELRAGDGCCPPGGDATVDPDCAPVCGNGVAEPPSETCDYLAAGADCPLGCPAGDACAPVRLEGSVAACTAACVAHAVTACVSGDGCCAPGCTIANDDDCATWCGDGVRSGDETCDRGITAGLPGACPRTCDDGDACTTDAASGTSEGCTRACSHARITACVSGDGCCPPGCGAAVDRDCAPTCGDGKLGAGETCDPPSSCPTSCPDDGDPCTVEHLVGDAAHCDVVCEHVPVTACSGAAVDECCPTGCTPQSDADCPVAGP
jgi:hypothetical protein